MSSLPNDKRYDEQLLAQAPEVTKADLQGGYNPDILAAPRPPSSRVRSPEPSADLRDIESSGSTSPPREKYHPTRPRSFWKTKKGIIVITSIVILVAVILGAVLGGVLGSKDHGHGKSAPSAPDGGNSTSNQSGGAGNDGSSPDASAVVTTTTSSAPPASSGASSGTSGSSGTPSSNGTPADSNM